MTQPDEPVTLQQAGPVLTVTLNRPELHNALNPALIAGLTQAFAERAQAARAHAEAVRQRNARLDAHRPPAAGLPLPATGASAP